VTLFSLAGLYVTLSATFLAIIQVLTYAGAILVLFIFIIMLLNLHPDELVEEGYSKGMMIFVGMMGLVLFLALGFILQIPRLDFPTLTTEFGTAATLARALFTTYVIPFEIGGVLLTVALIGAVLLAKRKFA
jgi:NADH-quinone oxidoreductase subunit J